MFIQKSIENGVELTPEDEAYISKLKGLVGAKAYDKFTHGRLIGTVVGTEYTVKPVQKTRKRHVIEPEITILLDFHDIKSKTGGSYLRNIEFKKDGKEIRL